MIRITLSFSRVGLRKGLIVKHFLEILSILQENSRNHSHEFVGISSWIQSNNMKIKESILHLLSGIDSMPGSCHSLIKDWHCRSSIWARSPTGKMSLDAIFWIWIYGVPKCRGARSDASIFIILSLSTLIAPLYMITSDKSDQMTYLGPWEQASTLTEEWIRHMRSSNRATWHDSVSRVRTSYNQINMGKVSRTIWLRWIKLYQNEILETRREDRTSRARRPQYMQIQQYKRNQFFWTKCESRRSYSLPNRIFAMKDCDQWVRSFCEYGLISRFIEIIDRFW